MISKLLARDLRRALANRKYDVMENGLLYFPETRTTGGGLFEHSLNGGAWELAFNLMPTQGLNAMLDIALGGVAKQTNWYMAPYATATSVTATLTAANFNSVMTEFTNYTETTRSLWTPAAASTGVITNAATAVSITIGSGVQTAIHGLALISASAKSSTGGLMAACAPFKDGSGDLKPRTGLVEGDILGLRYTNTLTSS